MTLIEIARIYTELVSLDDHVPADEPVSKDEISSLRSKYHQLLMDKMTEEGISFSDRYDAMRKAFELIKGPAAAAESGHFK